MKLSGAAKPHDVADLPNITIALAEQLRRVGISTADELCRLGAEAAWEQLHGIGRPDVHVLLSLEGAIRGLPWRELPAPRHGELVRYALRRAA